MNENWKPIKNFEQRYQVSDLGRVRSLDFLVKNKNGFRLVKGKILTLNSKTKKDGYLKVCLCKSGQERLHTTVHQLVAEHFVKNPENKPEVNHINGNKLKNNADNLEWSTRKKNIEHSWETGLTTLENRARGEDLPHKLNANQVLEIRRLREEENLTYKQIADKFQIGRTTVENIIKRKKWKHV